MIKGTNLFSSLTRAKGVVQHNVQNHQRKIQISVKVFIAPERLFIAIKQHNQTEHLAHQ